VAYGDIDAMKWLVLQGANILADHADVEKCGHAMQEKVES